MKYNVTLRLHQDDATGDYGLAHKNAIDINTPFNTFWTQQGIFHDVFEHYFEDVHKYFRGEYAFNIGGEVAAMGHYAYYMYYFHPEGRLFDRGQYTFLDEMVINTTLYTMQEAIESGYGDFGNELLCRVPYQKYEDYNLNGIIYDHYDKLKEFKPGKDGSEPEDKEYGKHYKKSVTLGKLSRLYKWGWRQAEKIAPRNVHNREFIDGFLSFWEKFVKMHDAKEMYDTGFRDIKFTITTGEEMKWDATWVLDDGMEVSGKTLYPEDEIIYEEMY